MEYTFGGKYKLEHEIGLGGCGTFFSFFLLLSFSFRFFFVTWYIGIWYSGGITFLPFSFLFLLSSCPFPSWHRRHRFREPL